MAQYDTRVRGSAQAGAVYDAGLRSYMLRVYNYMLMGLGLTGVSAWITANTALRDVLFRAVPLTDGHVAYAPTMLGMIAIFSPLIVFFVLAFRIQRMSVAAAQGTFWFYATLIGVSVASILLNFTGESVARVFFITAAAFGGLSLYGYSTKRDLSALGSFLIMGVIGLLITMVVNMFLQSTMVMWITCIAGVGIFAGLTAYDTQSIKESYYAGDDDTLSKKKAVMGALRLYMDFINMFMFLVQLLGNRR